MKMGANLLRQWKPISCIARVVTSLAVVRSRLEKPCRFMKLYTHLSPAAMPNWARAVGWMCVSATAKCCSHRRTHSIQSRSHRPALPSALASALRRSAALQTLDGAYSAGGSSAGTSSCSSWYGFSRCLCVESLCIPPQHAAANPLLRIELLPLLGRGESSCIFHQLSLALQRCTMPTLPARGVGDV